MSTCCKSSGIVAALEEDIELERMRRERLESQAVRDGWAELLSRYRWDEFATLTYSGAVWTSEKIMRNFKHWLFRRQVNAAVERGLCVQRITQGTDGYGRPIATRTRLSGPWWNAYRKGRAFPIYVVGIEPHKSGRLHAHAVICWSDKLPALSRRDGHHLWTAPRSEGGLGHGFSRIEPPRSQGDVADYVSKYVVKGGEIFISPSFDAARLAVA